MATIKALGRTLLSIFSFFAVVGIAYGIGLYFFGVTSISAQEGTKPVVSKVYVDDQYRGETPLKLRLGPGWFHIKVVPPAGYSAEHSAQYLFTAGTGLHISEEVKLLKYRVKLYAPVGKSATFEVSDAQDKPVGTCDGTDCEIPLPGPGYYHASMKSCVDTACSTGTDSFNLEEGQEEHQIRWRPE